MVTPLLAAEGLTVERGGRLVLRNLGLSLAPGETILVAGRNGAGKSTLLRTLAGLLHPAGGTIRYGLADEDTRGVETIHYLGYEDALKPSLTVRENLDFWAAMLGTPSPVKRGRIFAPRSRPTASSASPICRPPIFPPARSGASRSPAC